MNKCDVCGNTYNNAKGLYRHLREKHDIFKGRTVQCFHCSQYFENKSKLMIHIKSHRTTPKKQHRIKCSLKQCDEMFATYKSLRRHLNVDHSFDITKPETYTFISLQEFEDWKLQVEENHNVTFVKDCGERILADNKKRSYFICHRSYMPRIMENENRKRNLKNCGSNKIGCACPAMIVLTVGEKYDVVFYSTHIGHSCSIRRRPLSKRDRYETAEKLAQGIPMQTIIDDIRNTAGSEEIKRLHLIKKKDLHNIKRDFSISATKLHEDDAVTAKLLVDTMQASDKNSNIIIYFEEEEHSENDVNEPIDFNTSDDEKRFRASTSSFLIDNSPDVENGNEIIQSKCELLLELNTRVHLDTNQKNNVIKYLDRAINEINEGQVEFSSSSNSSINENSDILNIHSGFDHSYI